ncbi:MAG: 1,4-dihydroxy-2-naphthoate octaprenyltransferase [Muribaculaceae bacterium]|nr:1,4-dihydroxy-2-naphthoate octaprenyltransferase [Muribaculaceae bacterium]
MSSPSAFRPWLEAMRLRTLPVSVAGVLAGCACALAVGSFAWPQALICLFFAVGAQIASNFANEYYDYRNGLDRKGREGFRRGVTEGDISPKAMLYATYGVLGFTCLLGLSLIWWGGWWLIAVGIAVAVFAVAYSTGPWPLSHHGLGDVAVLVFFGIVPVTFTAWLQAPDYEVWRLALPTGVAVGLLAVNVLIVNNYRDVDDDRSVGKHTTVVIFGRHAMSIVYLIDLIVASILIDIIMMHTAVPLWISFVPPGFCFGRSYFCWQELRRNNGSGLNPVLKLTAMSLLITCISMVILCAIWQG